MANKKKLPVSIFELVWYPICALVILWGLTYVVLGLVTKYNNIRSLDEFEEGFTKLFGLGVYFWGLIIIAIGVVAGLGEEPFTTVSGKTTSAGMVTFVDMWLWAIYILAIVAIVAVVVSMSGYLTKSATPKE